MSSLILYDFVLFPLKSFLFRQFPKRLSLDKENPSYAFPYLLVECLPIVCHNYVFNQLGFGKGVHNKYENCLISYSYLKSGRKLSWLFLFWRLEGNALAPSHQMELKLSLTFVQLLNYRCIHFCVIFKTTNQLMARLNEQCLHPIRMFFQAGGQTHTCVRIQGEHRMIRLQKCDSREAPNDL